MKDQEANSEDFPLVREEVGFLTLDPNQMDLDRTIRFVVEGKAIIVLDKDGMVYKGKRVEDAGEAHRLFIEFMGQTTETGS